MKLTKTVVLTILTILSIAKLIGTMETARLLDTAVYQRITYNKYSPKSVSDTSVSDYHDIEIMWSLNDNISDQIVTEDGANWLYSLKRNTLSTASTDQVNEKPFHFYNRRLVIYLFDIDGIHRPSTNPIDSKVFVAWDITPVCHNTTNVKVSVKVKYFSCEERAKAFYTYYLVSPTNKALVNSSGVVENYDTTDLTFGNSEYPASDFLGGSYEFIGECPLQG